MENLFITRMFLNRRLSISPRFQMYYVASLANRTFRLVEIDLKNEDRKARDVYDISSVKMQLALTIWDAIVYDKIYLAGYHICHQKIFSLGSSWKCKIRCLIATCVESFILLKCTQNLRDIAKIILLSKRPQKELFLFQIPNLFMLNCDFYRFCFLCCESANK